MKVLCDRCGCIEDIPSIYPLFGIDNNSTPSIKCRYGITRWTDKGPNMLRLCEKCESELDTFLNVMTY